MGNEGQDRREPHRQIPLVDEREESIGLVVIFGYAFFKFSWSYRLFNYAAILIGATLPFDAPDAAQRTQTADMASAMNIVAGRHFNRGQRAFFFALAYLGWFIGPLMFCAMTSAVFLVMWFRQFKSDALRAVQVRSECVK